jgi:NodT family efflux transporter outer membrane factor (OMF) lipoprotein
MLKLFVVLPVSCALIVAGCSVGPDYVRPDTPMTVSFKETGDWVRAAPADALERGPWWELFEDPILNDLVAKVEVSNQNVAAAAAAYDQARAMVREQRAGLFPTVTLNGGASRVGGGSNSGRSGSQYNISLGGTWEPDVWGRIRRGITAATANAQASAADLASARLSAQGELATNYMSLRFTDVAKDLLVETIAGYERSLTITQNRYDAGIVPRTDVLQAQLQLENARGDLVALEQQRATYEHAIAVLMGVPPASFTLAAIKWTPVVPNVPPGVPSTLLQRRPDIAGAERRVAAANEQIGIAQSAYYPSLGLTASYGFAAVQLGSLLSASNAVWALGVTAAETLFNGGATSARVDEARAAHEQAVAHYRQTVLTAFQNVEDQLAAARVLLAEQDFRAQASRDADLVEASVLNRYRAGLVNYTDVVIAQVSALNARRALVQITADREIAAVALIQALGGGWQGLEATAPVAVAQ